MKNISNKSSNILKLFSDVRFLAPLSILVVLIVSLAIFTHEHSFIRISNVRNLLSYGPETGIIILGLGILMISGEFDLSVGSVLAFCSYIFIWLLQYNINIPIVIILTLLSGSIIGLINGLIVTKAKVVSFIATLGTMMFWRAITVIISTKIPLRAIETLSSDLLVNTFIRELGNIFPMQMVWFILFAIIIGLILHRSKFGNWIFATGDNSLAAKAMAINTDKVKIINYVIVGFLVSFVSILVMVRISTFSPRFGDDLALKAIAGVVIGGVSLFGGKGNIWGIIFGASMMVVIENGISIARIQYSWTYTFLGLMILFSVLIDYLSKKKMKIT